MRARVLGLGGGQGQGEGEGGDASGFASKPTPPHNFNPNLTLASCYTLALLAPAEGTMYMCMMCMYTMHML